MTMFGRLSLVTGPESFLAERSVARLVEQARAEDPAAAVTTAAAATLTTGLLAQVAGTDLFSSAAIACITGADKTGKEVEPVLVALARNVPPTTALIVSHPGGTANRSLLSALTAAAGEVVTCEPLKKAQAFAGFVVKEVAAAGRRITPEAAEALVDAVGQDTRSLAGAVSQLLADTDATPVPLGIVKEYFAGRATVSAYDVSDDALAGRVGDAIMKLRWALSTGVAHTLVTSAMAVSVRQLATYLTVARRRTPTPGDVGAPAWKMDRIAATAASWSERTLGIAIRAVSQADAQVKGAAQDPDFALESLIIRLAGLRRASHPTR